MKIIVVHVGDVIHCPPAISAMNAMIENGVSVSLCSTKSKSNLEEVLPNVDLHIINDDYNKNLNIISKFFRMKKFRNDLWKEIDSIYGKGTIIWVVSDTGIKNLGNKLLNYDYVLHLMELSEKIYYYKKLKFLKLDEKKIGNKAKLIVVPEYNRSHIIKAWWQLKEQPFILENKPFTSSESKDFTSITKSDIAKDIFEKLNGKKVILYQGIMHKERQLDKYIKAVSELGSRYAFVVMSDGENPYKEIKSENFYYIPFIEPPYHLEITNKAYIGVLSYFPVPSKYSILNALYCAPNKTFEYAKFGKPMIGNDIPALNFLFNEYPCGKTFEEYSVESIKNTILEIESKYNEMSSNSYEYYRSVNMPKRMNEAIGIIKSKI